MSWSQWIFVVGWACGSATFFLVRWLRYSEHLWLQRVRIGATVISIFVLLLALGVAITR